MRIGRVVYLFIVRVFLYMLGIISYHATICVRVLLDVWAGQVVYMGSLGFMVGIAGTSLINEWFCSGWVYPQSAFG